MNYNEAMEYIESTAMFGSNLGLARIEKLLEYMGNPEKNLKCIHIAGTNGKGSVTTMISEILMEAGYKVGIYTSPYLERFSERIKINDSEISEDDIAKLTTYIKPIVDRVIAEGYDHPTEFEIITAIMFKYFYEQNVDYAAIEVGLGGRLDSTNVIEPLVSVITTISYDHMAVLGDTLGKIAYEKAGIIKENGIVVSYPQEKEAQEVIEKVCLEKKAKLLAVGNNGIALKKYSMDGQIFDLRIDDDVYENIEMKLIGEHQLINAKTAVTAVRALKEKGIDISRKNIFDGLKNVRWHGRLEVMGKNPAVVLDGAHNIQGIRCLKKSLDKYFSYNRLILVTGMLRDKQYKEMCGEIMPEAHTVITVTPDSPRALTSEELGKEALKYCADVIISTGIEDAYKKSIERAGSEDLILFCGSLYMIGHVRSIIEKSMR